MKRYGCLALCLLVLAAQAKVPEGNKEGVEFQHDDWELACDNTGTCRAAGYQAEADERAVTLLLTRKAGANQPVEGRLMLGAYGEDDEALLRKLPDPVRLQMRIDDVSHGTVSVIHQTQAGTLTGGQADALVRSLAGKSDIEFVADGSTWHLSDAGAAAVLLKMDDYQRRIGTRGALMRPGSKDEQQVRTAQPVPVVHAAKVVDGAATALPTASVDVAALRSALIAITGSDDCQPLADAKTADFQSARLNARQSLVSVSCWQGAYNEGRGFWIINNVAPLDPVVVTTMGSDYSSGVISSSQKGRGLGDCWATESWVWDGRQFVHTASSTTGMCKLIAPGGAWELPTVVTEVR